MGDGSDLWADIDGVEVSRRERARRRGRPAGTDGSGLDEAHGLLVVDGLEEACSRPESSPVGSWMTPSSVTVSLTTIFPMSLLLPMVALAPTDGDTPTRGNGRRQRDRHVRAPDGVNSSQQGTGEEGGARVESTDLMSRACAGDGDAFRELTEAYRRELQVHCCRMLGSPQDGEDALQDTLVAAWRGFGGFEGRASLRTWLYRIATNRCLDARRAASRRPAKEWNVPSVEPPEPTRLGEVVWLEPYPDALLTGATAVPLGPEARCEQRESISLAFLTALQVLPPRQVAVLVLRDVLGFHASEVAEMLDSNVESVNGALKRARANLQRRSPPARQGEPAPIVDSDAEKEVAARFARAWESADIGELVNILTDDVFISMPPCPSNTKAEILLPASAPRIFGAG